MGLRAPLYIRRCIGRRRCAIPCALLMLLGYGMYSKIVPVPEAVQTEVDTELAAGMAEAKGVAHSLEAFGRVAGAGGFEPGKAELPHSKAGEERAAALLEHEEEQRIVDRLKTDHSATEAMGRQTKAATPGDALPAPAPVPAPPPPPPPPPPPAGMAPLTAELMSSMDAPAKRAYATSFNTNQEILNRELLPTPLGDSPVIVVMVHNRPLYFARVLRSLEQVRGIEKALLVVSLDYLSPEMDALVRGIKFCAVVQIFCPASAQLYAAEFPGTDPRDCAGGWDSLPRDKAKASGCINWATPDKYGHYREAKVSVGYRSLRRTAVPFGV
jgi:hypothetical protein